MESSTSCTNDPMALPDDADDVDDDADDAIITIGPRTLVYRAATIRIAIRTIRIAKN